MVMPLLLLYSMGASAAPATTRSVAPDPPVRVWFNSDGDYRYGDRAKVYAKAAEDGNLVVLRADAGGQVRVLFPIDPDGDQHVRGGKKYELKGRVRGGRHHRPRNRGCRPRQDALPVRPVREERALGLQRARRGSRTRRSRSRSDGPRRADAGHRGSLRLRRRDLHRITSAALRRVGGSERMGWLVGPLVPWVLGRGWVSACGSARRFSVGGGGITSRVASTEDRGEGRPPSPPYPHLSPHSESADLPRS